jgi:hypothetical protein
VRVAGLWVCPIGRCVGPRGWRVRNAADPVPRVKGLVAGSGDRVPTGGYRMPHAGDRVPSVGWQVPLVGDRVRVGG